MRKLTEWQQRVVEEKQELDEKREKLIAFLDSDAYGAVPAAEGARLMRQDSLMTDYSDTLGERIAAFNSE